MMYNFDERLEDIMPEFHPQVGNSKRYSAHWHGRLTTGPVPGFCISLQALSDLACTTPPASSVST